MQDRQVALRGKENWYKEYYMPTPCDGLVIAGGANSWFLLGGLVGWGVGEFSAQG
jgi:hypothetical protein